jgi:hypothetical protein
MAGENPIDPLFMEGIRSMLFDPSSDDGSDGDSNGPTSASVRHSVTPTTAAGVTTAGLATANACISASGLRSAPEVVAAESPSLVPSARILPGAGNGRAPTPSGITAIVKRTGSPKQADFVVIRWPLIIGRQRMPVDGQYLELSCKGKSISREHIRVTVDAAGCVESVLMRSGRLRPLSRLCAEF